jgi:hypothetical protein
MMLEKRKGIKNAEYPIRYPVFHPEGRGDEQLDTRDRRLRIPETTKRSLPTGIERPLS